MKVLKKGICLTGEIIGLSTEVLFRASAIGINKFYKKMENGNNKNIEKIAKNIGEKASSLIVKESQEIAKNADKLANNLTNKTKNIVNKAIVNEVKVYGSIDYFYNNEDFIDGEFKVYE